MSAWPTIALKDCVRVVGGATPKSGKAEFWDGDVLWTTPKDLSDLNGKFLSDTPRKITEAGLKSCAAELLPANSVLFSSRAPIGHIAINSVPMATNQGFKSMVPGPNVDASFLYWWLKCHRAEIELLGNGATFKEVSKSIVERMEIPLPPLEEQKRIAAILDQAHELRRKRQRAIDRLNQLGHAIFHEMFGSDPSDQELGAVCDVSSGSTPSREISAYYTGDIPWVKTGEVNGTRIHDTSEKITEDAKSAARLKLYPPGTILIAMYGQGKTRGQVGLLEVAATTNQACAAIRCSEEILAEFLFLQLKMSYERIRAMGRGGNQPNLNAGIVKQIPIMVPSLKRQQQFVDKLRQAEILERCYHQEVASIDRLLSSLQHRAFRGEL